MKLPKSISDLTLLRRLLEHGTSLSAWERETFRAYADDHDLNSGAAKLPQKVRYAAVTAAQRLGLLRVAAPVDPKAPKRVMSLDQYSEKRTANTDYAEQVLAKRPSKPPPGRAA